MISPLSRNWIKTGRFCRLFKGVADLFQRNTLFQHPIGPGQHPIGPAAGSEKSAIMHRRSFLWTNNETWVCKSGGQVGDRPGRSIQGLMKATAAANDQEIFSRAVKMFKSVRMTCYKEAAFRGLDKGRHKILLHRGGRTNDAAIGIRRMMTTDNDRPDSGIVIEPRKRRSVPILLFVNFSSGQLLEI